MLRFIRSHFSHSAEFKSEDLSSYFHYSKVCSHGFPQKASCIAIDEHAGHMAIGTRDGWLRIVTGDGFEVSECIGSKLSIAHIYFAPDGSLVVLSNDTSARRQRLHVCRIDGRSVSVSPVEEHDCLRNVTACIVSNSDDVSRILIGTGKGEIYAARTDDLTFTPVLSYENSQLTSLNLPETDRSVDQIMPHPTVPTQLFMVFNRASLVLYDTAEGAVVQSHMFPERITNLYVRKESDETVYCSHVDGAYSVYDIKRNGVRSRESPFGPYACTPIERTHVAASKSSSDDLVIFSGGMPKASYGDRYTVTAICGEKEVVFDFASEVLDFAVSHNGERGYASALFVLCEEELVTIDLEHPLWRCIPLRYFYPLHSSPVTSVAVYSNVAEKICAKLYEAKERLRTTSREYSTRGWPLLRNGNETTDTKEATNDPLAEMSVLVTGHENGVFKVWDTSSGGFNLLISHETAREFEGYKEETPKPDMLRRQYSSVSSGGTITSDEDDNDPNWPPFRKVGLYDPFADDTRLAVSKLSFDPDTGEIVVGGRSGHTIAYELQTASKDVAEMESVPLDMTEETAATSEAISTTRRVQQKALEPRAKSMLYPCGYQPCNRLVAQFLPVTAVTAVAWHPNSQLVAVGNEFGYAIYSLSTKQALVLKSLISTNEIMEISNLDGALSRFKSMKKSIRQSFRRKKRAMERHLENPSECDAASSIIDDFRSGERQIASRSANPNVLGGEPPHSLVRILQFARCSLLEGEPVDYYLFVGTSGSTILIHSLTSTETTSGDQCPLVREIRLQHRAPIVHLDIIPGWNGASRLLVMSEEQIRTFNLPGLKSGRFKCKFTATEGLRIRKAQVLAKTNARKHKHPEPFLGFVTNQGSIYVMSLLHPRRQYNARFTRHTDASGIAMSAFSAEGELFFLRPGGTEFQRSRI